MSEFQEWDSFSVIVGSAAGALIGLQFVVMTLISERPALSRPEAARAFATPTIIHFCAVLCFAALLRVPWKEITPAAASWGAIGILGAAYVLVVARRITRQTVYRPDWEDWLLTQYCRSWRMRPWQHLPLRRDPTRRTLCSVSVAQRCCCCSSAFTTRGMLSRIMCS
jgi:hypothetical protein